MRLSHFLTLIAGLVLAVIAAGYLGALHPAFDSLSVLRPHAGLAAVIVVLAAALTGRRPAGLISLAALFLAVSGTLPFAMRPEGAETTRPEQPPELRVVSLNMLHVNPRPEQTRSWIARSGADIVLLQEVSYRHREQLAALRDLYPVQMTCVGRFRSVAILSRLQELPGGRVCAGDIGAAALRLEGPRGPLTAVALHLFWPWPYSQERQIARLLPWLGDRARPLVLGGDFNMVTWSHRVSEIADASDTALPDGLAFSLRLPDILLPLPIDHVLADPALGIAALRVGPFVGSDHRPVIADLR